MSPRYTSDPAWAAEHVVGQLREHGVTLPADVEAAVKALEAIKGLPALPANHLAETIAAGGKPAEILAALQAEAFDVGTAQPSAPPANLPAGGC